MAKRKSQAKNDNNEKKDRFAILIPAVAAIVVALIGAIFGFLGPLALKSYELQIVRPTSQVSNSGDMEDFSPHYPIDPDKLGLVDSPTNGLFISKGALDRGLTSWSAHMSSGILLPAEAEVCLMNKGYPPPERRPLNRPAHSVRLSADIYWEGEGMLTVTAYEVSVDYVPLADKIDSLEILTGAAGGGSQEAFVIKEMPDLNISTLSQPIYSQEIKWLNLNGNEGITFLIPVELNEPGNYSFQVKFLLILTSKDQSLQSKHLTLTTGQMEYTWARVDDPRKYSVSAGKYNVDLVECP